MTDIVDKATRSRMMSGIKGANTKPEIEVRRYLHRAGFRFRIAPANLVGKPDIVLPKYGTAVFVHGCFWHRHPGCKYATTPQTNHSFWAKKFGENVSRDTRVKNALRRKGWRVVVIWECEVSSQGLASLKSKITRIRA